MCSYKQINPDLNGCFQLNTLNVFYKGKISRKVLQALTSRKPRFINMRPNL